MEVMTLTGVLLVAMPIAFNLTFIDSGAPSTTQASSDNRRRSS